MSAPTDWSTAAAPAWYYAARLPVTYRGGYWLVTDASTPSGPSVDVWWATDPAGTWTQVTPYTPTGTDDVSLRNARVEYDGTDYATTLRAWLDADSGYGAHVVHATDPTGTWSHARIVDGSSGVYEYEPRDIATDGADWAVTGYKQTFGSPDTFSAFVSYAASPGGTWTTVDDPTGIGDAEGVRINYGGGGWVLLARDRTDGQLRVFTASTPGGTWTECASFPYAKMTGTGDNVSSLKRLNGFHVFTAHNVEPAALTPTESRVYYAALASGTWSQVDETDLGIDEQTAGDVVQDITYGSGAWMLGVSANSTTVSAVRYLHATGSPAGTYANVADADLQHPSGYLGAGSIEATVDTVVVPLYGYLTGMAWATYTPPSTRPRYLRQRQSPRQSIRVDNDLLLRQRQRWI